VAVATEREYGRFIGGEQVEAVSGEIRELVEPATGEPLVRAAMAGESDVDRAVAAAREALDGAWGKTTATERSRLLHALADAIVANRAELAELETLELYLETKSVIVSTASRPINPFGL
jgi:acyl-CoA reductase-like NAD-dependent aldehyde dehydrogenase